MAGVYHPRHTRGSRKSSPGRFWHFSSAGSFFVRSGQNGFSPGRTPASTSIVRCGQDEAGGRAGGEEHDPAAPSPGAAFASGTRGQSRLSLGSRLARAAVVLENHHRLTQKYVILDVVCQKPFFDRRDGTNSSPYGRPNLQLQGRVEGERGHHEGDLGHGRSGWLGNHGTNQKKNGISVRILFEV